MGTGCASVAVDKTLPIPFNVHLQRSNVTTWKQLTIQWDSSPGYSSFIVTISIDRSFPKNKDITQEFSNVKSIFMTTPTVGNTDLRKVVHYVHIQSVGKDIAHIGQPSPVNHKWFNTGKEKSCLSSGQYLNASSLIPLEWKCSPCPEGGGCAGSLVLQDVRALFGWYRCPLNPSEFSPCKHGREACLGAANPALRGEFYDINHTDLAGVPLDLAMEDNKEWCLYGHVNPPSNNTRCSTCEPGWVTHSGLHGLCTPCDNSGLILVTCLFIVLLFIFVVEVGHKMKHKTGQKGRHMTFKRIVLSHIQLVSVVIALNVPWPERAHFILTAISGVVSIFDHPDWFQCSSGTDSVAEIFYIELIFCVFLPVIFGSLAWVYWFVLVPIVPALGCAKNIHVTKDVFCVKQNPFVVEPDVHSSTSNAGDDDARNEVGIDVVEGVTTAAGAVPGGAAPADAAPADAAPADAAPADAAPVERALLSNRDGFITTMVYFLYIQFPSSVKISFETFNCEKICGQNYFSLDNRETCWLPYSRHYTFILFVAVPSIILYVFILPVLTVLYLWIHRHLMKKSKLPENINQKFLFRFGILFSGCKL